MKAIFEWWQSIDNKNLFYIWFGVGIFLFGFQTYTKVNTDPFYGIVESKQQIVNTDYPVKIARVYVSTGSRVRQGDRLIELDQDDLKIRKIELEATLKELVAEANLMRMVTNSEIKDGNSLAIQMQRTQMELELIKQKIQDHFVYAASDAIVGDINFKLGEQVSPFSPIMTLYAENSYLVKAYMHEAYGDVPKVGERVNVWSGKSASNSITAEVYSVGKRVVPFPLRLTTYPGQSLWGREILVRLPANNKFDLGEKVSVQSSFLGSVFINDSIAETVDLNQESYNQFVSEKSAASALAGKNLIFAEDIRKFIVVSEGRGDGDSPRIQFLSPDGRLENSHFSLDMLPSDARIESIVAADEAKRIRISYDRSGASNHENQINFLSIEREGMNFIITRDDNGDFSESPGNEVAIDFDK